MNLILLQKIKPAMRYFLILVTAFSLGISAALKAGFLFSCAFILVKLGIVPVLFLTAMGVMQLTTALGGGVVSYSIIKIRKIIMLLDIFK